MTTQTIDQERAVLARRRVELMTARGECAKALRDEHIDVEARRELKERQTDLTSKIRAVENELATLDDAEQSEEEERKGAAIAEEVRRRRSAAASACAAGREVVRWSNAVEEMILSLVRAVKAERAAEADFLRFGQATLQGFDAKDQFRMACYPLLSPSEMEKLLAEVPKGVYRSDLAFASTVGRRVDGALGQLPQEEE